MEWGLILFMVVGLSAVAAFELIRWWRQRGPITISRGTPASLYPDIDPALCKTCGACVEACPEKEKPLAIVDGLAQVVQPMSCIGHGECQRVCPYQAITLVIGDAKRGAQLPELSRDFESSLSGLYIVGELGGMGLIYNAITQAVRCMRGIDWAGVPRQSGVYQAIIVGAGPAGIAASLAAREAGLDFVTLEQEPDLGGTVRNFQRGKLVMTKPVELPLHGKIYLRRVEKEALFDVWNSIIETHSLRHSVRFNSTLTAFSKDEQTGLFHLTVKSGETYTAQRVLLALGRRVLRRLEPLQDKEFSDPARVLYRLDDATDHANQDVLVCGGGNSAVESAMSLAEAGARVVLSYRKAAFQRIHPDNLKRFEAMVPSGKIRPVFCSKVSRVLEGVVELQIFRIEKTPDGKDEEVPIRIERIDNDLIFVFFGGTAPVKLLENGGVSLKLYKKDALEHAN